MTRQSVNLYHQSVCGSILLPLPTKNTQDIFDILRHANFDRFRRCLDVYYKDIMTMRNEFGQTVLHILTIHAYPYQWIRLLMMREYDFCSQDNDGYTAAHYAAERDDVEMLKALTMKLHSSNKIFSSEQLKNIHVKSLKALTIRQNQGLTVFMLACLRQSFKCLEYLIQLEINDVNLQDNFGDSCLHYAVARRSQTLVDKLINQCQADVNGGDKNRPSVLDIVQFHREQDANIDRTIENQLVERQATNRCRIKRIINEIRDTEQAVIDSILCTTENSTNTYEQLALTTDSLNCN